MFAFCFPITCCWRGLAPVMFCLRDLADTPITNLESLASIPNNISVLTVGYFMSLCHAVIILLSLYLCIPRNSFVISVVVPLDTIPYFVISHINLSLCSNSYLVPRISSHYSAIALSVLLYIYCSFLLTQAERCCSTNRWFPSFIIFSTSIYSNLDVLITLFAFFPRQVVAQEFPVVLLYDIYTKPLAVW